MAVCYVGNSSVDFMADAKRIQQNYLKRSSSTGERLKQLEPPAVSATSQIPNSSANPHPAVTMVIDRTGPIASAAVPANTNVVHGVSPPSPVALASPRPVTSTPRSQNVVKPQSAFYAQSNSVVFRAAARPTRAHNPAAVGLTETFDSPTRL